MTDPLVGREPGSETPPSVEAMFNDSYAPTAPLADFRSVYDQDDNIWWMTASGHHMNLFDAACEELDAALAEVVRLREENERLRDEVEAAKATRCVGNNHYLAPDLTPRFNEVIAERDAALADLAKLQSAVEDVCCTECWGDLRAALSSPLPTPKEDPK